MSASPHVLPGSRDGFRMGDAKLVDTMIVDGLWDVYNQYHMGTTAENVAEKYEHHAPRAGRVRGRLARTRPKRRKRPAGSRTKSCRSRSPQGRATPLLSTQDEYIKAGTTLESLAGLKPAFARMARVTAGNASGLNDGAAAVLS